MILPTVLVCLWSAIVGVGMMFSFRENVIVAGRWLFVTAMIELFSNAAPSWTGNLGEVIFLLGFIMSQDQIIPSQRTFPSIFCVLTVRAIVNLCISGEFVLAGLLHTLPGP